MISTYKKYIEVCLLEWWDITHGKAPYIFPISKYSTYFFDHDAKILDAQFMKEKIFQCLPVSLKNLVK